MAINGGKILGRDPSELNNAIATRFQDKLPHKSLFNSANISIGSGESPDGKVVQAQVLITLSREDAAGFWFPDEDMSAAMETMKPKVLILGDERVRDGVFVLASALEGNIIRLKFSTENEAKAYKEHFNLAQYNVFKVKVSLSSDQWFEGKFSGFEPESVGFLTIDPRVLE